MSGSTITPAPSRPNEVNGATGRYLIVQPSGTGLTMMVDTVSGRSWFRIAAGADHYAWRPMRFEATPAETPR